MDAAVGFSAVTKDCGSGKSLVFMLIAWTLYVLAEISLVILEGVTRVLYSFLEILPVLLGSRRQPVD